MLYEELRVPLTGESRIETGRRQRFAFEVSGRTGHFYVGDMDIPQLTFDLFEGDSGAGGFKPRVVGGATWLDNMRVTSIDALRYSGPPRPVVDYDLTGVVTDWRVLGPLTRAHLDLERSVGPGTEGVDLGRVGELAPGEFRARSVTREGHVPGAKTLVLMRARSPGQRFGRKRRGGR